MKAMPTLEGGLRIDTETTAEWEILRSILVDANAPEVDLANRLGNLMAADPSAEDWRDYVVPDLREGFLDGLAHVGAAIEAAMFQAEYAPGPIWITPEDAGHWYSALNQARLGLEECFHFGTGETLVVKKLTPEQRSAWSRGSFYQALQGMLLDHVLK